MLQKRHAHTKIDTKIEYSSKINATEKVKNLYTLKASIDLCFKSINFSSDKSKEVFLIKSEEELKGSNVTFTKIQDESFQSKQILYVFQFIISFNGHCNISMIYNLARS